MGPCSGWGNGGAVNTTGQAALGDNLEGRVGGGAERIDVGNVRLEVVCVGRVVLLYFGLTSLFGENVEDLSRLHLQYKLRMSQFQEIRTHHSDSTLCNDLPGSGATD